MSHNMMEAYQVKMEQLADDIEATRGLRTPAPGLWREARERIRQLVAGRPRLPLARGQAA